MHTKSLATLKHQVNSGRLNLEDIYTLPVVVDHPFSIKILEFFPPLFFFVFVFVKQLLRNKLVSTARDSIRKNANLSQLYRSMQDAYTEMQTPLVHQTQAALVCLIQD